MQPSENGNLAVSLLDERGEVIETRLYAVSAEDLIALGGEESLTFPVEFEQEGRSVTASYFTAVPDEWENKLAKLNVTGTVLNQQFEPAVADLQRTDGESGQYYCAGGGAEHERKSGA